MREEQAGFRKKRGCSDHIFALRHIIEQRSMHNGSESCVTVSQGHTDFFNVDSRVREGNSLSSLLFNIVLDFVMKKVELIGQGNEWTAGRRLRNLVYADDLYLLADDMAEMR